MAARSAGRFARRVVLGEENGLRALARCPLVARGESAMRGFARMALRVEGGGAAGLFFSCDVRTLRVRNHDALDSGRIPASVGLFARGKSTEGGVTSGESPGFPGDGRDGFSISLLWAGSKLFAVGPAQKTFHRSASGRLWTLMVLDVARILAMAREVIPIVHGESTTTRPVHPATRSQDTRRGRRSSRGRASADFLAGAV